MTLSHSLTGLIVVASIATAGAFSFAATMLNPTVEMKSYARVALSPINPASLQDGADPISIEQGRVYYVQLCMPCHGSRGDGRGEWAYRVTPRPTNLTGHVTRARSDAQLLQLIGEPQPGTPMIGWKKQLSESQLSQLVAFVRYLGTNAQWEIHH
jgi:mono/diheme cytochrome c family protein